MIPAQPLLFEDNLSNKTCWHFQGGLIVHQAKYEGKGPLKGGFRRLHGAPEFQWSVAPSHRHGTAAHQHVKILACMALGRLLGRSSHPKCLAEGCVLQAILGLLLCLIKMPVLGFQSQQRPCHRAVHACQVPAEHAQRLRVPACKAVGTAHRQKPLQSRQLSAEQICRAPAALDGAVCSIQSPAGSHQLTSAGLPRSFLGPGGSNSPLLSRVLSMSSSGLSSGGPPAQQPADYQQLRSQRPMSQGGVQSVHVSTHSSLCCTGQQIISSDPAAKDP